MPFDFSTVPDRRHTGSLKWDKYQGRDILPLWVADMDFRSPPAVIEALRARAEHGIFGYTVPTDEARQAVVEYVKRQYGYVIQPEWIVWSHGLVPALSIACRAFAKPGEGVVVCTPIYPPMLSCPVSMERRLIPVPLKISGDRWEFNWPVLESAVTPDARIFILCSPHNPIGRAWSRAELAEVAQFCAKHNLVLVSDEIHCDLMLDVAAPHTVTASLGAEVEAITITQMAASKTYNLPGLACAFSIIADPKLRAAFTHAAAGLVTEINAFGYAGTIAAFRHGEPWRRELIAYLRANRDFLYDFAGQHLAPLKLLPMQATYLAWLDARALGVENLQKFFEDAGVGLSPGHIFGDAGRGWVRLNFGCPRATLEEALKRLEKTLVAWKSP
ncbi:MAG TPA: PatB family C-S lyase [Opitutales bacterium]|nr:PatB family C-S lyase [Opitutales bacterium]